MISNEIFLFFKHLKKKSCFEKYPSAQRPKKYSSQKQCSQELGGNQVSQGILAYLGVAPTAHHCIPFGNVYTAWMADQVVVHSSHISILVSRHRAINVVEYGVLITIELTVFKPWARLSKEYIKRDLRVGRNKDSLP